MCERERRKEALNSRPVVAAFCSMLLFLVLIFNEQCAHVHCRFQFETSMHDICDLYTHSYRISTLHSLSLSLSVSRFRVIFSLSSVIYGCTTNISLHSLHVVLIIPLCIVGYRLAVAAVAAFRLTLL